MLQNMKAKWIAACCALLSLQGAVTAQVLVETESFAQRGGWVLDHQAFDKIESASRHGTRCGRRLHHREVFGGR